MGLDAVSHTAHGGAIDSGPRLSLFDGFELRIHGVAVDLGHGAQRLLAFLALQPRPLRRSYVAGTLWSDVTEERAAGNLRTTIWRLRFPDHDCVHSHREQIELAQSVSVDIRETERSARLLLGPEPLSLDEFDVFTFTGELLPGWYEDWVLIERERRRQLNLHALEALSERFLARRRFGPAVMAALTAVKEEPLRESAHRILVRAYLEEGNVAEALRQYRGYATLVRDELGVVPSPAMRELVDAYIR